MTNYYQLLCDYQLINAGYERFSTLSLNLPQSISRYQLKVSPYVYRND